MPVFVALHGLGSQPEDFAHNPEAQAMADETGAAIVSVSGTEPWGKNSFSWSENYETDWAHIQKALEAVKDKVTPLPGNASPPASHRAVSSPRNWPRRIRNFSRGPSC